MSSGLELNGLEKMGPTKPPRLTSTDDLKRLAWSSTTSTQARLTGRASPCSGMGRREFTRWRRIRRRRKRRTCRPRRRHRSPWTVQVPHHGSTQNMTRALVEAVACPQWVFSSDGTLYRHPDAQAIAKILHFGVHPGPTLALRRQPVQRLVG